MAYNHYAKLKLIIESQQDGWYIKHIDRPTAAKNFRGEIVKYDYYYRLYTLDGEVIKYGKFQKLDKLARILKVQVEELPVIN